MLSRNLMNPNPITVRPNQTAVEVARLLNEHGIDDAPVLDAEHRLLGIVSKSRLLEVLFKGLSPETPVIRLTAANVNTLSEEDDIRDFWESAQSSLPVIKDGKLTGYITRSDMLTAMGQMWARASEDLQAIGNAMHNPLVSIDAQGNIRSFNKALEKILGRTARNIQGRNIKEIFKNTGLLEILETGEARSTQKIVVGDRVFISNRSPIIKNGQIVGAVAVMQDVSELETISQELESTKRLASELDAIIESSFDGLYVTDGEGTTLRVNQGFCRITGVPKEECIGRNMAELVETGVYSRSGSLLAIEKRERVTITLQARTGKWVLVTSNPIFDEAGNIVLVVTNVRDVTELSDLQRKLEQAEGLSQFYRTKLEQLTLSSTRKVVARSGKMQDLLQLAVRLAAVDSTVFIQGESGVGKEMIADIIHANSERRDGPFIKVNCGAIPENLLESELFGYEPGAFTGASKTGKPGLFELAGGGTIFLDEIAELPMNLQVKLLRVLQERQLTRVGGTKPINIDIRILAGTNQDLTEMIKTKQFRMDLFYRLNVVPIQVPPLRERREDIPALILHFLDLFNQRYHMNKRVSPEVIDSLMRYDWPGNVRELENLIERMMVTSVENVIDAGELPAYLQTIPAAAAAEPEIMPLKDAMDSLEHQILKAAFARYDSTYQIAKALKVNQSTIVRKAAKYGIKPQQ
ncbi:MAG: sigma 54-interacting transcriptional regulator [Solirubrobacterales bacterium]